jgi:hypothetical protein
MRLILPPPLEPVEIDLDRPLEEQLSGETLRAATVMLEMLKKSATLWTR